MNGCKATAGGRDSYWRSSIYGTRSHLIAPNAPPIRVVNLGDLHVYDPVALAWTDLTANVSGMSPSPRYNHGFTSTRDRLYVHGGLDEAGDREFGLSRIEGCGDE